MSCVFVFDFVVRAHDCVPSVRRVRLFLFVRWTLNNLVKIKKEKRTSAHWRQCVDLPYNNIHYAINTHHHSSYSICSPQIKLNSIHTHTHTKHRLPHVGMWLCVCMMEQSICCAHIFSSSGRKIENHEMWTSLLFISLALFLFLFLGMFSNLVYHYFYELNILDIYCIIYFDKIPARIWNY